jgi:hypothetical protein
MHALDIVHLPSGNQPSVVLYPAQTQRVFLIARDYSRKNDHELKGK